MTALSPGSSGRFTPFKHGQKLDIAEADVVDYIIASEGAGVVDPGLSERIAETYGLMVS